MEHLDYALLHTDLQHARLESNPDAETVLKPFDTMVAQAQNELSLLPIEQRYTDTSSPLPYLSWGHRWICV